MNTCYPSRTLPIKLVLPSSSTIKSETANQPCFRGKRGDESFWTEQLFRLELDNLVEYFGLHERGFDLYGQS